MSSIPFVKVLAGGGDASSPAAPKFLTTEKQTSGPGPKLGDVLALKRPADSEWSWGQDSWSMPAETWGTGQDSSAMPAWAMPAEPKQRKLNTAFEEMADDFLKKNNIQPHAQDRFWQLSTDLQMQVMESGSLSDARDPTAVLISRIGKAHAKRKAQETQAVEQERVLQDDNASPVDIFLAMNKIEAHAAMKFRELPPDMQAQVIDAGSLADARDPTAVLISRMKRAQSGTAQSVMALPGDWICMNCGEHNFARNQTCRKCGTPNSNTSATSLGAMSAMGMTLGSMISGGKSDGSKSSAMEPFQPRQLTGNETPVEEFIIKNAIQPHAAERFKALPPEMQRKVMDAGSLAGARDPTAVLMSRMRQCRQGTLESVEVRPGDWKCQNCGDHNFARNKTCRSCGALNTNDTSANEMALAAANPMDSMSSMMNMSNMMGMSQMMGMGNMGNMGAMSGMGGLSSMGAMGSMSSTPSPSADQYQLMLQMLQSQMQGQVAAQMAGQVQGQGQAL